MQKRNAVLATVGLVLAAGCTRSTDFDITKPFDPVNSDGVSVYTYRQNVDMADEAGSAWKHRSKVKSLELVALEGTMTANYTATATTGGGSIVLSRAGLADVTVGTWANEPIPSAAPHTISTTFNPAAVSLIENALHGDGLFDVTFTGSTANPISFAADVTLHLKLKYKVP